MTDDARRTTGDGRRTTPDGRRTTHDALRTTADGDGDNVVVVVADPWRPEKNNATKFPDSRHPQARLGHRAPLEERPRLSRNCDRTLIDSNRSSMSRSVQLDRMGLVVG